MVYFGETGQCFDARVQQHQTAVKKFDIKNGIAAHVQQTVRWSEAKCIDQHTLPTTIVYLHLYFR